MRHAAPITVVLLAASMAMAGCGLGPGNAPSDVRLTVTRDFGSRVLQETGAPSVVGAETVMRLLTRNDTVGTRYGGGFVQSINGLSGGHESGQSVDWFYYVNGIEASKGAAETKVHPGDRVWWDRHDWAATQQVPAVVGSFPEPFLNGMDGKRLPVRIDCSPPETDACRTVTSRLRSAGVPAALGSLGTGEPHTLSVLVGPWSALHGDPAAAAIERGPRASGVYARFSSDGRKLTVLDPHARPAGTLSAGSGLVAATRYASSAPTWVVTGTDAAGVDAAAHALDQSTLRDRFAIALAADRPRSLPVAGP